MEPVYPNERPILYIMVVGFHHKKGCQLEFVYPNDTRVQKLTSNPSDTAELYKLPKKWKHLPSLALPDGSHNYETDYIYFHLEDDLEGLAEPSTDPKQAKKQSNRTLFGVSCYRQINASELIIKDVDVTRNTLQKSVCILARLPIYSSLRVKLYSITAAYFEQKDFHKTELLINAYDSLLQQTSYANETTNIVGHNKLLNHDDKSKYFIGLSLGDLVLRYQHKILVLFKLMLLQKKCLFQIKPVSNLSNTIISLVSLIPDIFLSSESSGGLDHCSGFFDSIDLVNYELEQKSNRKKAAALAAANGNERFNSMLTQDGSAASADTNTIKKTKKLKKKLKSFSKKHQHGLTNSVSSGSLASSFSLHSIKTVSAVGDQPTINENVSTDTHSIKTTPSSTVKPTSKSKNSSTPPKDLDLDLNRLVGDKLLGTPTSGHIEYKQSKLDFKSNIYSSKQSNSSSSNGSLSNPNQKALSDEVFEENKSKSSFHNFI